MEFETIEIEQQSSKLYQSNRPEFTMVGTQKNFAYAFGACKEYVLDYTLYSLTRDKSGSPYFKEMADVFTDEVRLACKNINSFALQSLDLVNTFEKAIDYPLSIIKQASKERDVLIFCGSPKWFIAPPMLSLYALMVRVGCHHKIGNGINTLWEFAKFNFTVDASYLSQATSAIQAILKYGPEKIFGSDRKTNWPVGIDIHNRGIVSFGTNNLIDKFPQWYEFLKLENMTRFPGY